MIDKFDLSSKEDRLVLSDWLEEQGRDEESMACRTVVRWAIFVLAHTGNVFIGTRTYLGLERWFKLVRDRHDKRMAMADCALLAWSISETNN